MGNKKLRDALDKVFNEGKEEASVRANKKDVYKVKIRKNANGIRCLFLYHYDTLIAGIELQDKYLFHFNGRYAVNPEAGDSPSDRDAINMVLEYIGSSMRMRIRNKRLEVTP